MCAPSKTFDSRALIQRSGLDFPNSVSRGLHLPPLVTGSTSMRAS